MLSDIYMTNIQSAKDVHIALPETGVVRFLGRNGNGKSIFVKVLKNCCSGEINDLKTRKSLISRWATEGTLKLCRHDGKTLTIHISLEASRTYVELYDPATGTNYRRYLNDGRNALIELTLMFGIHYDYKRDISLNIYETFGGILFLTTSPVTNFDVMSLATSDYSAELAKDALEVYIKEQEQEMQKIADDTVKLEQRLQALSFYDIKDEQNTADICEQLIVLIASLRAPEITYLPSLPDISMIQAQEYIPDIPELYTLPDISMLAISDVIPSPIELKSPVDVNTIKMIGICNMIPSPIELYTPIDIQAELKVEEIVKEIAEILEGVVPIDGIAELVKSISCMEESPEPVELDFSLQKISKLVKVFAVEISETMIPDVASDLINLAEMKEALDTMTCPLCGAGILEDGCNGGVAL